MKLKIIVISFLIALSLISVKKLEYSSKSTNAKNQAKYGEDTNSKTVVSTRIPRSRSDKTRGEEGNNSKEHHLRLVPFSDLSKETISEIRKTMVHVGSSPNPNEQRPALSSNSEALSILGKVIGRHTYTQHPHSGCDGEEFFLYWGGHSLSPQKGLAIRKKDRALMAWAFGNDHIWADSNDPMVKFLKQTGNWDANSQKRLPYGEKDS